MAWARRRGMTRERASQPRMIPPRPSRLPDRVEWQTVAVAAGAWSLIVVAVATHPMVPWWITVPTLAIGSGWYASLQHEVAHGHPTPWPVVNLALAGAPIGVLYPYARFRDLHLAHHLDPSMLTDPVVDNESRYCSPEAWARAGRLQRLALRAERTLVGALTVGVVRGSIAYVVADLRATRRDARLRRIWARHLVAVAAVIVVIVATGLPLAQFAVGAVYGRVFFTGLRTFAEHRAVAEGTRTAVVRAGWPMALIYLNNNLHHTHHAHPAVAWYELPALHRRLGSDELALAGAGLYSGGYLELWRRYGLRPFCQPVHPLSAPAT